MLKVIWIWYTCGMESLINTLALSCSILPQDICDGGIWGIIGLVIQILTYAIGVLATVGIVISAVQYTTAGDDPGKVATAKKRMIEIAIGVVAYAFMATIAQFLIPGGVF